MARYIPRESIEYGKKSIYHHKENSLHDAARWDSDDVIRSLAKQGHDVNRTFLGEAPLHVAAKAGSKNAIQALIEHAADINKIDSYGRTPLHVAAEVDSQDGVQALVENAADINATDYCEKTSLHYVALSGSLYLIQYLIEGGANINAVDEEGQTPLHVVIRFQPKNAVEVIQKLVRMGANINAVDGKGRTLLHSINRFQSKNSVEVIQTLVEMGANINAVDRDGQTPLHYTTRSNSRTAIEHMQKLVEMGANINAIDRDGRTPLHWTTRSNSRFAVEHVQKLVEVGANINAVDEQGRMPLHEAVHSQNGLEVVKMLLAKGANIEAFDNDGSTPLHEAVHSRDGLEVVEILLAKGANIEAFKNDGSTPLHEAVRAGSKEIVQYSLEKNAYIDTINAIKQTTFHEFVRASNGFKFFRIVQILIKTGANIETVDINGQTPLHRAACTLHHLQVVEILLENGANIEAIDNDGKTPLYEAVRAGSEKTVGYLLEKGANIEAIDNNELTPLHEAVHTSKNSEIVQILLENGANTEAIDISGQTPLHYAARSSRFGSARVLLRRGANVQAIDNDGKTPLHHAVRCSWEIVIFDLLTRKGANIHAVENNGWTAFRVAIENEKNDVILQILCDRPRDFFKSGGMTLWEGLTAYQECAGAMNEILTISRLNSQGHCYIARSASEFLQAYYPTFGLQILNWIAMVCKKSQELDEASGLKDSFKKERCSSQNELYGTHQDLTKPTVASSQEVMVKGAICARIKGKLKSGQLTWMISANSGAFALDVQAALTWILTILRSPRDNMEGVFSWKPTPLDLGLPKITRFKLADTKPYCWTKLFSYACVADLSSLNFPSHSKTDGLEIDFDILLELAAVDRQMLTEDGLILLGFDTALIPLAPPESRRWHFLVTGGRQITSARVKKAYSGSRFQGEIKPDYCTGNVYVGWCASPVITIGTINSDVVPVDDISMSSSVPRVEVNEESVERSSAHDVSFLPRVGFLGSGVGGSWVIKRERRYRQTTVVSKRTQKSNFEGVLDSARATPCILWDDPAKKGWLMPAVSALLVASLRYAKWKNYSFK